ncbi:hypothetical protein AcV7_006254 [Taiwanofungus camphoratus]|nr:hypothetical protein AcV7_006254 [Antrodia cinnamomea]
MFGSLKIVDLHNNKLIALPDSFADLTALTVLDLSYNALTCLPVNLFALPNLTALNISHNTLTSLPFRAPFDVPGSNPLARTKDSRGDWFSQSITRATAPLPRLTTLDASHNHLAASAIDHAPRSTSLPAQITKLDLSANPLGLCVTFIRALSSLERLRELRIQRAEIADDSFPIDLFTSETEQPFPALRVFDLEETHVSRPAMEGAFSRSSLKQELEFDVTTEEPHEGVLRIVLGKRVTKEAWEVEAERRAKLRRTQQGVAVQEEGLDIGRRGGSGRVSGYGEVVKEAWEIEAEQGLLTEGAKRRARAAAAAAQSSSVPFSPTTASPHKKQPVEKEAWELEAERGMLTAGAQRRARAAAVATAESISSTKRQGPSASNSPPPTVPPSPSTTAAALSHPRFYSAATQTLTLPTSTPPSKAPHTRSFSLAAPSWVGSVSPSSGSADLTLAVPTPTLPLAAIATLPSAHTLKVLTLANRRKDPSFSLPSAPEGFTLPNLEELSLEGCNLAGSVPVSYASASVDGSELTTPRTSELLLPLLARLFPNLSILDLSFNSLDSAALTKDALISLILATVVEQESEASHVRKGLRHLRLRGNRITELDGFQGIAELFKGNRDVPGWKLEELDLRDNEIGKLPAELGLLPLDVFLVDGNVFRVPARRVWEREGTKGLLSWLRGRIE